MAEEGDIWRDTNEEARRAEWRAVAKLRRSVRTEMDSWRPRSRDSAKRMKQSINQIRLDVSRTWGEHSAYATDNGRMALERVLVSWVAHNPVQMGYCQSMNFLAAVILAVCKGNEDEALTIFTSLLEDTSFGDYFHRETNFQALEEDTTQIKQKLLLIDSELIAHLDKIGFDLSSVTPAWLLTCFFLPIGPCKTMQVMDNILRMGKSARRWLINETTVTFLERRRALFACTDLSEIHQTFRRRIDAK